MGERIHGARPLRVLFVSDSHIGFDQPSASAPLHDSRAGDFLRNHCAALRRALEGDIDLVVHGGDLLHRSRVSPQVALSALEPLREVAEAGVPVFFVPGNHERSRLPYPLLAQHPELRVFERARTWTLEIAGVAVAVGGFAYARELGCGGLRRRIAQTGLLRSAAGVRLLCMHQAVEGASVGPRGAYVFRTGDDVVAAADIPSGLAAVLCGHVHRHQVLMTTPQDTPLGAPVIYAGSVERTTAAERHDAKGYVVLTIAPDARGGRVLDVQFEALPVRPMFRVELDASQWSAPALQARLEELLGGLDQRAIVDLIVTGVVPECAEVVSAEGVRRLHPETMRVRVRHPEVVRGDEALFARAAADNDDGLDLEALDAGTQQAPRVRRARRAQRRAGRGSW